MTRAHPPRLAVALLQHFVDDNDPLVGDLLEGFAVRESPVWFWRQVFLAIAIRAFQRRNSARPLGLAEDSAPASSARELMPHRRRQINLTASPLPGIGGLGLVALGVLVALVRPHAWLIFLPAVLAGVVLGLILVIRRHGALSVRDSGGRSVLFGSDHFDSTKP
jgi:hypothetical protein